MMIWVVVDIVLTNYYHLVSLLGLIVILVVCVMFSKHPYQVHVCCIPKLDRVSSSLNSAPTFQAQSFEQ